MFLNFCFLLCPAFFSFFLSDFTNVLTKYIVLNLWFYESQGFAHMQSQEKICKPVGIFYILESSVL